MILNQTGQPYVSDPFKLTPTDGPQFGVNYGVGGGIGGAVGGGLVDPSTPREPIDAVGGGATTPPPATGGTGTTTPPPATTPPPTTGSGSTTPPPAPAPTPVPAPNPVTVLPGAGATPTTAGYNSDGTYTPQNDSVVDQVNKVVSSNSPLMQRAMGIGMAVANSRGLQNSTLAGQAAQKSMLDAAVPIASQEAQQLYGKNLQFMQGKTQIDVANLNAENQRALQDMQSQTQLQLGQMQVDSNMSTTQLQTAAATQTAFSNALLAASQSYSANVSAIMQNPDLDAAARSSALSSAATQRDADFAMVQKVYGVSIAAPSTTGTGAGTTPAAAANDLTWSTTPATAAAA